jgi:hypothetical protein
MVQDLSSAKQLTARGKTLIDQARAAIQSSRELRVYARESIQTARSLVQKEKQRRAGH